MLIMGSITLRSLHSMAHVDNAPRAHTGCQAHHHATTEHDEILGHIAQHHAPHDEDEQDHHSDTPPTQHHCGICSELAATNSDAGLFFAPLVFARDNPARNVTRAQLPCAIESPKVALANPPPTIEQPRL